MEKESVTKKDEAVKKRQILIKLANDTNNYEELVDFEDVEASKRSQKENVEQYLQTCKLIRQLLIDMAKLKEQDTEEARAKITGKKVQISMQLCVLKKINRLEKLRMKAAREALHQQKLQVDSLTLQFENLLYQQNYAKNEISKCLNVPSLADEIDLVSEEDFFKHAPDSIARPNVTKTDKHQLQIARFQWERVQRKQLVYHCKHLEVQKKKVTAEIVGKQERLDNLAPQLKRILEVAKPLEKQLGITTNEIRKHRLAYLLPNPLHLLYTNTYAYSRVYDKCVSVYILGEEEEAKRFKQEAEVSLDFTADSDSDQDISQESVQKPKRISYTKENKQSKLIVSYPLYVRIEICLKDEKNFKLILDFYYKTKLQLITVDCQIIAPDSYKIQSPGEVLSNENVLKELFSNDTGNECPNPMSLLQLEACFTNFQWPMVLPAMGRAYLWAQRICGFDFPSATSGLELSAPHGQTTLVSVMKLLTTRLKDRILLAKQMKDLENNIVPIVADVYRVPLNLSSSITSWSSINWEDYRAIPSTEILIENEFVSPNDMFYKCTISRKTAILNAYIAIKNKFPEEKSIFAILLNRKYNSNNCDNVRDMERAVNTDWPDESTRKYSAWLLCAQIRRMMACFDIYTEVKHPKQYENKKIFFAETKGRTRAYPYKYLQVGGGVFTQY